MGYRGHIVTKYDVEYGSEVGNSWEQDGFSRLLKRCEIDHEFERSDGSDLHLIYVDNLQDEEFQNKIEQNSFNLNNYELQNIKALIETAQSAQYVKMDGTIRVEWF